MHALVYSGAEPLPWVGANIQTGLVLAKVLISLPSRVDTVLNRGGSYHLRW
jgi:hypothetical protein